ncbi:MAG TPA: O-antigen ligase family protein [Solirubrobacteraceae bacterium]|nr:O-antigen ligase family protein [Solirubrobacteraceae bacterium]
MLYLGLNGGGYGVVVSSQVGLVLWWIVLVAAAWKVLPAGPLTRVAWGGLALFGGFVAWTALASTWSLSSARSLQDLSLVASYLAVLLLAVAIHRDREQAVRHSVNAIGAAIVIVAALAVISRVDPSAFPAAHVTGAFLGGGAQGRLSWPLNYWNGLAALVALGLPLVLSIATSARKLRVQALAAASLPLLALCAYLTFSRGGAIAASVAVLAFLVLAPDRFPKLATALVAGAGGAVLIAAAAHRSALEHGAATHAAFTQGRQLLVAIFLVCGAVALAQVGIGLAARHGTLPRLLRISPRRARVLLAGGIAVAVIAAVAAGAPSQLSRGWNNFKNPVGSLYYGQPSRFESLSGTGRYQYWKVAVHSTSGHLLTGSGPGTFQLLWLPRATVPGYVVNAHSLYVETLAEVGVVGLALLVGFFVLVLGAAVRLVMRSEYEARARAAGAAAALLAFMVSAVADWVWQLPVLPAAFLLLAAAVLAPAPPRTSVRAPAPEDTAVVAGRHRTVLRLGLVATALACVIAIGIPLAAASAVSKSQAAARMGKTSSALADARSAVRLEPGAAAPQLQLALVLELQHNYAAALAAAHQATRDESQNWSDWLVLSRIEAESGQVKASVVAYRRARSLNPRSPLFQQ